jgi:hypothetical protein
VIISEIIVHLLVIVQNYKRYMIWLYETNIITIQVSELYRKGNHTDAPVNSMDIFLKRDDDCHVQSKHAAV